MGVMEIDPLGEPPVEKPVPAQLVALVLPQVRSVEPPIGTVSGLAESVAATAGITVMVWPAGVLAAPPEPEQVTTYSVVAVGATSTLPLVAPPVSKPVPTQLVASVLDQVSWLVPPTGIVEKSAESVAVTAAPTVTVVFAARLCAPPAPEHVTE